MWVTPDIGEASACAFGTQLLCEQVVGRALHVSKNKPCADAETCKWLNDLDDRFYEKLSAVGLVEPRTSGTLGQFLEEYIASRTDLKPGSLKKLVQAKTKLLEFFDARKSLRLITRQDASNWRNWLATKPSNSKKSSDDSVTSMKLSEATIKNLCGSAKTFFNEAVRRRLISDSPVEHLKSGPTASRNTRYVTADEAQQVIDACPNQQWRLLFGLARYAGLSIPSESHLLTWDCINWVPVTDQLMPILLEAFEQTPEGESR